MDDRIKKKVIYKRSFLSDLEAITQYGKETFGFNAAEAFSEEVMETAELLEKHYLLHPESRHLPTKSKRYRNVIFASYLIIYRIEEHFVSVLRILHSKSSISKIKQAKKAE